MIKKSGIITGLVQAGGVHKDELALPPGLDAADAVPVPQKDKLLEVIQVYSQAHDFDAVVPISARTGQGVGGVSTKTNWLSPRVLMPQMRFRVVWGLLVTMATFSPTKALVRVDLPTLGRPHMVNKKGELL